MSLFDSVGAGIQIKSTPEAQMKHYEEGDDIPLPDGLHLSYEGAFIVKGGQVLAVVVGATPDESQLVPWFYDKWGGILDPQAILDGRNPIAQAIAAIRGGENDAGSESAGQG